MPAKGETGAPAPLVQRFGFRAPHVGTVAAQPHQTGNFAFPVADSDRPCIGTGSYLDEFRGQAVQVPTPVAWL
jgi:hypothetical protein